MHRPNPTHTALHNPHEHRVCRHGCRHTTRQHSGSPTPHGTAIAAHAGCLLLLNALRLLSKAAQLVRAVSSGATLEACILEHGQLRPPKPQGEGLGEGMGSLSLRLGRGMRFGSALRISQQQHACRPRMRDVLHGGLKAAALDSSDLSTSGCTALSACHGVCLLGRHHKQGLACTCMRTHSPHDSALVHAQLDAPENEFAGCGPVGNLHIHPYGYACRQQQQQPAGARRSRLAPSNTA